MRERDLRVTRIFLDAWGKMEKEDFNAYYNQATTPA